MAIDARSKVADLSCSGGDPQIFTFFAPAESIGRNMKTTHVLATLIAATLPLTTVLAEDTAKPAAGDQTKEKRSQGMGMMDENKGMMMGMKMEQMMSMMSDWKDQDAELDKLVAEMNSASADKKLDAVAAALSKLVEQRKALHEQMQKMMGSNETDMMKMCRMMMRMMKKMKMEGDQGSEEDTGHSQHH
jgi:hypothetical protein